MYYNKTLIYQRYTQNMPVPGEHLVVESCPFDPDDDPPAGGFTVKNLYLSLDPYMRGQMRQTDLTATYSTPWTEGQPAVVTALSVILKSNNPAVKAGDLVYALTNASEYAMVPSQLAAFTKKYPFAYTGSVPLQLPAGIAPSALIGALGVAGLSAYASFFEFVPEARLGKTLVVSAAAGGVGQLIGQIAKMQGMKVIGSTGSDEKVDFVVRELEFDAAWNYKTESTACALKRLAPEGVDVYYDNVGGEQLETALRHMKNYGIVIMSGMMSELNKSSRDLYGVKSLVEVILRRLKLCGFVSTDPEMLGKYATPFEQDMGRWLVEGRIKTKEEVVDGIENSPLAFINMLQGNKFGKMVVKTGIE
ncbi:NAD(P)-binding protein [Xylariaceae sp. FL0255]|nr:NAD(P)-binding protein [Xylariaceae sp. FL0255]